MKKIAATLLLLIATLPLFAGQFSTRSILNLIAGFHFNENSGTTAFDTSGNGLHGAVNGGVTWVKGKWSNAADFNGSTGYLNCGSDLKWTPVGPFAVFFGANLRNLMTTQRFAFADGSGAGNSIWDIALSNQGNQQLEFAYFTTFIATEYVQLSTQLNIATGTWHHYGFVKHADNTLEIFVDGVQRNGTTLQSPGTMTTQALNFMCIGRAGGFNGQYLNGAMDEFLMVKRDVSLGEIRQRYHQWLGRHGGMQ